VGLVVLLTGHGPKTETVGLKVEHEPVAIASGAGRKPIAAATVITVQARNAILLLFRITYASPSRIGRLSNLGDLSAGVGQGKASTTRA
jgi:hypothetical protein